VVLSGTRARGVGKLAIILGIRPDLIRASLILRRLQQEARDDVVFIWSGQHYSDNLKDVFLRELEIDPPDIELGAVGSTDAEVVGSVVSKLYPVLAELRPAATVFLGDTNTVMGCLAAGLLNIPVVHIEGAMRSYDWRMPEEKYRTVIDHLSDVIYTYFEEYKAQAIAEGINPRNVVVVQNLIVDVLDHYYFARREYFDHMVAGSFFDDRGIEPDEYYLMTCHRRENVEEPEVLSNIVDFLREVRRSVYFPASYRTQRNLEAFRLELPAHVTMIDPIGYDELLALMANARAVITDSGTVVEETAILQVPSLQIRRATERPQVYDCGSAVKFDPSRPEQYPSGVLLAKLEWLHGRAWSHGLGDGRSSDRVSSDLLRRLAENDFRGHEPEHHHLIELLRRSHREDELPIR
jgi:UDP-N-acetylglucosamine 2-epimerase